MPELHYSPILWSLDERKTVEVCTGQCSVPATMLLLTVSQHTSLVKGRSRSNVGLSNHLLKNFPFPLAWPLHFHFCQLDVAKNIGVCMEIEEQSQFQLYVVKWDMQISLKGDFKQKSHSLLSVVDCVQAAWLLAGLLFSLLGALRMCGDPSCYTTLVSRGLG